MTPREADVAFVLESVPGARALYALEPGTQPALHYDFALELEPGGGNLAEAHYALLRVLTHDECARVFLFVHALPAVVAQAVRLVQLDAHDREAARARVPPPPAREPVVVPPRARLASTSVLLVGVDAATAATVREVLVGCDRCVVEPDVARAVTFVNDQAFDLIVCEADRAFGTNALLARLPLDVAARALVLVSQLDLPHARQRLQGFERILMKPLEPSLLRERLGRIGAFYLLWEPGSANGLAIDQPRRRLAAADPSASFSALLVDLGEDVTAALDGILSEAARVVPHRWTHEKDPEKAAELALSVPFHLRIASADAALHPRSFLARVAREDPAGADSVLIAARARDVPYVHHKLGQMGRTNTVLALPLEETRLRSEILKGHPALSAQMALVDATEAGANVSPPRFRRLAALVVDDDPTTQILFSAAEPHTNADVALATTPMAAFEHVVSRPVDVLLVSASMRSDGGEPFYRVLWRLEPELKARSVLITPSSFAPPSSLGPQSQRPRALERPVTRDAIARVLAAATSPAG